MRSALSSWAQHLREPVDPASLAAFRIAYGTLMAVALVRFWAMGWIRELYIEPRFHFTYFGFSWVRVLPGDGMYILVAVLIAASILVALGVFFRFALATFLLGFVYLELIDVTYYLNHYYAITLFGILLLPMPADRAFALRGTSPGPVPRLCIWVLRAQLGIVYVFAGIAKLHPDWLLRAEPLATWLRVRTEIPLLGSLFAEPATAFVMSYAGLLFDLTIPFLLSIGRTRALAYVAVVAFHCTTALLFRIGMFPWVMIGLTPIFFAPEWPRRWLRSSATVRGITPSIPILVWPAASFWFAIQCAMPLRHLFYPGDVLWTTEGFRWSWQVMIAEKAGRTEFVAVDSEGHHTRISPGSILTPLQAQMMSSDPSMILEFAHFIRDDFAARGQQVEVYADVWVAWGGRRSQRLVDPTVDLAKQEETLAPFSWIERNPGPFWGSGRTP